MEMNMKAAEQLISEHHKKKMRDRGEDFEETMAYKERRRKDSINAPQKNAFMGKMEEGINSRSSIFDRHAAFHISNKEG